MRLTQLYHLGKTWISSREMTATVAGALVLLAISLGNTSLLFVLKYFGKTQSLELMAYDRAIYLRPDQLKDERILIVGITEDYINQSGKINPSDQDLVTVLDTLSRSGAAVIGVDLYRNAPQEGRDAYRSEASPLPLLNSEPKPHWQELSKRFQEPNVISITTFASPSSSAIPPPPTAPLEQVGFNDLLLDPDGVIRRSLLMGWMTHPETDENESFHFSLALTLATNYLAKRPNPILPQNSADNPDLFQLGKATFVPLTPGTGGYENVDAEGYQILLNYRSRYAPVLIENESIEAVSFLSVLKNEVPAETFKDKVVLIGSTDITLKDVFSTPYSNKDDPRVPGVFIHAQATSQILDAALGDRPLLWYWPSWIETLWIFAWAMLGGSLAWRCRPFWLLNLAAIGMFGSLGLSFYGSLLSGGWIPIATPAIGSFLTVGGMLGYRAQQAQQQRNMMQSLLGQSISPAIAAELWKSRDDILQSGKLPGQKLTATILFSDIKGFSTLSEKQPPDELLDWLNQYLKEMIDAVVTHGGIVNKFTGDGMLAVFGVPVKRIGDEITEDARQAVRCALAMRHALDQLNQTWLSHNMSHVQEQVIQMRVGIFTGPITAGSIGSKERLEYGVIGDSVNTASRLESCLKARHEDDCRILIANETMQHLISPDLFKSEVFQHIASCDGEAGYIPFISADGDRAYLEIESWGPRVLKGKDHKVNVYRIVRPVTEVEALSSLDSPQSPQSPPQPSTKVTESSTLITEPNYSDVDL